MPGDFVKCLDTKDFIKRYVVYLRRCLRLRNATNYYQWEQLHIPAPPCCMLNALWMLTVGKRSPYNSVTRCGKSPFLRNLVRNWARENRKKLVFAMRVCIYRFGRRQLSRSSLIGTLCIGFVWCSSAQLGIWVRSIMSLHDMGARLFPVVVHILKTWRFYCCLWLWATGIFMRCQWYFMPILLTMMSSDPLTSSILRV